MGHQIIRQPDGLLAVFSNSAGGGLRPGTDPEDDNSWADGCWILMGATQAELEEYYAERAAKSARESARQAIEAVLAGEPRMVYEEADQAAMRPLAEELAAAIAREEADGVQG